MSSGLIWLDGTLAAIGVVLDIDARGGELELNADVKELKPMITFDFWGYLEAALGGCQ